MTKSQKELVALVTAGVLAVLTFGIAGNMFFEFLGGILSKQFDPAKAHIPISISLSIVLVMNLVALSLSYLNLNARGLRVIAVAVFGLSIVNIINSLFAFGTVAMMNM